MKLIHKYLPNPRHTEINRIFVNAKPEVAWQAARHFDASVISWVRMLFDIRALPDMISGKRKETDNRLGVDQITAGNTGFFLAEEIPGKEVVVASAGQFWHLEIPFAKVTPDQFAGFNEKGWGKLSWGFAVEPYRDGSTICLELRTTATDDESWKKLSHYYQVIGIGSKLIRYSGMKQLQRSLGRMEFSKMDDLHLAGDQIIPDTNYAITFGINIEAPVDLVWKYLMQLGCDRAGWYSIDWVDHGGMPSTDHLVEGWSSRNVGDKIPATLEDADGFFHVYEVSDQHHLVIGGETERMGGDFKMTWVFVVEPIGQNACRLISRAKMRASDKRSEWFMGNILYPPVHGLMSGVQLKTIKHLAERDALVA